MKTPGSPTLSNFPVMIATVVILMCALAVSAAAQTEHTLYTFAGLASGGTDGDNPEAGLATDAAGNLYGTTTYGGTGGCTFTIPGCGTVYEVVAPTSTNPAWSEVALYSFTGGSDGAFPSTAVALDSAGNIYGETYSQPGGVIFKLSPPATSGGAWSEATIYTLSHGDYVAGPLGFDGAGNVFGTAYSLAATNEGSIFELAPPTSSGGSWTFQTIYRFKGTTDGSLPGGPLLITKSGAIVGTAQYGGLLANCRGIGCGVVFRLLPPTSSGGHWTESVLYSFQGGTDGQMPLLSGVISDKQGNLYGTTGNGGSAGDGTVFKLTPPAVHGGAWTETILHSFDRMTEAYIPQFNLVMDRLGNIYGTTSFAQGGDGAVFKLAPPATAGGAWTETLYNFKDKSDGGQPMNLVLASKFNWVYGAAAGGGTGPCACGTVFKITP